MDDAEFARWSRAVLGLLTRTPDAMSSAEIAEGIGSRDESTLERVLEEMEARGLVRTDPDPPSHTGGRRWRRR